MYRNNYFTDTELELLYAKGFYAAYFGDIKAGDVVALAPKVTYPGRRGSVYLFDLRDPEADAKDAVRSDIEYVGVTRVEHDTECDFDEDDVAVNIRARVRFIGQDDKGIQRHYEMQSSQGCYVRQD